MDEILSRKLVETTEKQEIKELSKGIRFDLPEKILQFGTGGFLRGFTDYLVDKANKQQLFNGSILVVKSTPGQPGNFARQDNLYTVNIKDKEINEFVLAAALNRVVSATDQWELVLEAAQSPSLQLLISNTTEAGLQYLEEDLSTGKTPASFPGKVAVVLHERFKASGGSPESGLVILPCELVVNNGKVLQEMVVKLAGKNNFEPEFIKWLNDANHFCNTIVDRIIPGKPDPGQQQETFARLGYTDQLLLECESYLLWAIEGGQRVKDVLEFAKADDRVIITDDIEPYREQKLRLLNGTHTFSVPLAFLCGQETVYQAVNDPLVSRFMQQLMQVEIAPTLEGISPRPSSYARQVFERFQNPHIVHKLINIMFQQSTKMKLRNAATIQRYFKLEGKAPRHMALGLAAYLLFMKNAADLAVEDDMAVWFKELWAGNSPGKVVNATLEKLALTKDAEQTALFAAAVLSFLEQLLQTPAREVLEQFLNTTPARP
ncbi:tagaturonate reductase [Anseongella ginsenosidimutans]|uniref:Tagaturonate reductase n=1 Tax=Anseongella ginsenosidimutans TaxID=496056 RepID=A0A4V2UTM7_9SPHI|nr:tagaturonate reductase [Anseongella ginsenosidimutans]QEC52250.1 tagaturonate reductase [Anseongella ginsenosidimutans]TCS86802.1 tagaturonate reductase [Anseongella ginsenosidimutans]